MAPGTFRQIVPGGEGVKLLCLGGTPGRSFEVNSWTEFGALTPGSSEQAGAGAGA